MEHNMFLKYSRLIYLLTGLIFSSAQPTWAFNTKNGNIYDANGNQISIDGIAWIGFQDSNFLGGLWNVPFNPMGTQHGVIELLTSPWTVPGSNVTSADNGVSFKAMRLAIQPGIWHNATSVQSSPFNFSVTDINNKEEGNGPFCDWSKGADGSGHCIQSKTAPDLLTATMNEFNKQNILVMLDFHHRPGLGDNFRDGTVIAADYSLKDYHDDVANFVKTAPKNLLGIDVYNEPHQLFWYQDNTQTTPVQPSWIKVIAAAATAVYDSKADTLLFVEGPGGTEGNDPYDPVFSNTATICLPSSTKIDDSNVVSLANDPSRCPTNMMRVTNIGSNWGENFRSLLDTKQSVNGVAKFDVTTFRSQLIQAIQTNNFSSTDPNAIADWLLGANNDGNEGHLVFAPHLYGSQVAGWQSDANDSPIRFDWNFGFLLNSGFPFVIGELGYDVQMPAPGGQDFFVKSVAPYLINKKINHNLFFWTFNNADYPVGLRASDSDLSLFAWKEQDLHDLFSAITPVQQYGKLCVTVPTPVGYTGTQYPVINASAGSNHYSFSLTAFDTSTCMDNVATGTYTLTGTTLTNSDGIHYVPSQTNSAVVTQNTETDVSVKYVQEPNGNLTISVAGDSNCTINSNQIFTVTYSSGSSNNSVQVVGTTPKSVSLPVGSYTISVSPLQLPSNTQCAAKFNSTVNITANNTTQEAIQYSVVATNNCSVKMQCGTWGTPQDPWAGSSCNLYITTKSPMTKPAVLNMVTNGITAITGVWNATANLTNGNLTMTLSDPIYVPNIGFNASGIITLPTQATLTTNGQTNTCPVNPA